MADVTLHLRFCALLSLLLLNLPISIQAAFSDAAGAADPNDTHYYHFVTRPDLGAPKWTIQVYDESAIADGHWFIAPYAKLEQNTFPLWNGPHIYDGNGELIWSGAAMFKHYNTFDFQVVQVHGKPMLSIIVPHDKGATKHHDTFSKLGEGDGFVLDSSYNVYKDIDIRNGHEEPNMHDLTIFDDGNRALMLTQKTYDPRPVKIGKFDQQCKIGWQGFRETNLETGEVVFEWDAEGHIDPYESNKKTGSYMEMCRTEWDILHLNSVDKFDDGDYLLCARHTNTIYKISHKDGSIVWRLGGANSDFEFLDEDAKFTRQHHAKFRGQNETHTLVSLFNNAKGSGQFPGDFASGEESSGLLLALRTDVSPMTVETVSRYPHPNGRLSPSRGSLSFLDNGNAFLGWVYQSVISEHAFDGKLLFKARLRPGENTYRSYKSPWIGRPSQPPDAVSTGLKNNDNSFTTLVHVSWNGATEVASWELLHVDETGDVFETVASAPRNGFETAISHNGFAEYVAVVALDKDGNEIGRSKAVKTTQPVDAMDGPIGEEVESQKSHSVVENTNVTAIEKPHWNPPLWLRFAAVGFALGVGCCLVVGTMIWCLRRQRKGHVPKGSWWRSQRIAYNALPGNEDDDIEQDDDRLGDRETK